MHTLRRLTRQHALAGVLTLLLALLLSAGWGQVHRVLHGGSVLQLAGEGLSSAALAVPGLADEDGSSLCKLLDQLTHVAGAAQALLPVPVQALPAATTPAAGHGLRPFTQTAFDARGPPLPS